MEAGTSGKSLMKASLLALLGAVYLSAATIVVSFPAYDVVLKEAFPAANVVLLTKGVSDPHEYQLTASDVMFLRNLTAGDVLVLSMHAPFELRIAEMAERGEVKARVIDLTKIQLYLTYDGRLTPYASGVNPHDHGVFPPNVFRLVEAVANATGLPPDEGFMSRLKAINSTYCCKFNGKAVALTPAAQYILYWLGFRDVAVLIKDPEVPPTPDDFQKAIQYAAVGAPVLAVVAKGEASRIVDQFLQKAREQGIQPRVVVADFSKGYLSTLEYVARQVDSAGSPAASPAPASPSGGYPWLYAVAALLAVLAAVVLLKIKRS